jgi:glycosyltransferase involved in cell wall biosynthesis
MTAPSSLLLVNQHTVPVFTDVVNAFASRGHSTRLFTGHIEPGRVTLLPNVRIIRSKSYSRKSTRSRLLSWCLFSVHYFSYLLFCKKPSAIVVVSNPPMAPFVTAIVAHLRNIPFVIVIYDLYPEALQQAGLANSGSLIYKWWQRNNRWTFSKAQTVITLSASMKNAVAKYVDDGKITVISNWADADYIVPMNKATNPFAGEHSLKHKFVVLYSGNMGLTHDLESLIEAAALLTEDSRIIFILIGEGGKRKKLETMKQQKGLSNVIFLPYQDSINFPLAMASADVGIVTLGTGAEGISVPSKTYVNMAAGLALIAISPPKSELNRLIEQYNAGYIVNPGEHIKLAGYIRALADNDTLLTDFKQRSREASTNFTSANARAYVQCVLGD